jgi:hypothetical protein
MVLQYALPAKSGISFPQGGAACRAPRNGPVSSRKLGIPLVCHRKPRGVEDQGDEEGEDTACRGVIGAETRQERLHELPCLVVGNALGNVECFKAG